MSEFDKEAEREKLRERFAEEDEKRETTERMSELLLQGATMTNSHCDTCGDPLFRYDGQTFCSTCQRATDEGEETTAEASAGDTEAVTERATDDQQIPIDDQPTEQPDESRPQATSTGERRQTESRSTHSRREVPSPTTDSSSGGRSHSGSTDDLAAAEASLSRTVHRLASAAEETEDIGRVRDQLEATREAAEALEAVRKARR